MFLLEEETMRRSDLMYSGRGGRMKNPPLGSLAVLALVPGWSSRAAASPPGKRPTAIRSTSTINTTSNSKPAASPTVPVPTPSSSITRASIFFLSPSPVVGGTRRTSSTGGSSNPTLAPHQWPKEDMCAPAAISVGGKLYLFQSTFEQRPIWVTTTPETGRLEHFNPLLPQMPGAAGPWDPAFFHDEETDRWFMYFGSSNLFPIYGIELDYTNRLELPRRGPRTFQTAFGPATAGNASAPTTPAQLRRSWRARG